MKAIMVGAAKRDITPTPDMLPLPDMRGLYEGVRENEPLMVKAIVIDNGDRKFLICGWDLAGVPFPDEIRDRFEAAYGFEQDSMLLFGTHNHMGYFCKGTKENPSDGNGMEDPHNIVMGNVEKVSAYAMAQSMAVVADALANMKPAKYGYGEGKSFINVNRDKLYDDGYWMQGNNWEGCSDKTLAAIKFVDYEGNLIAAILNYAMHANSSMCSPDLDGKNKLTCGIPGIASKMVEQYYGGDAVVLWQSGAAGNQNPYTMSVVQLYDPDGTMRQKERVPGAAYQNGVALGQQHGMDALRTIKSIDAAKSMMKITTEDELVYFPTQKYPDGVDLRFHRLALDNFLEWGGYIGPDDPQPEKHLVDMVPCEEEAPMKAQLILLGDIAIWGIAAELYNEIGVKCKEISPYKNTMIVTHIGEPGVGYLLDDASTGHKVFQSYGKVREGRNDEIITTAMLDMFEKALQK
ncbi:MAG: hypothetical protein LUG61_04435 [Lachnospiraceae bacterium]|nr:hypothetical protein [Lachnospiraceae bacterium]